MHSISRQSRSAAICWLICAALLLPGCIQRAERPAAPAPSIIADPAQIAGAQPAEASAAPPATAEADPRWAHPVAGWVTTGVGAVELGALAPTRAARLLALVGLGMDLALAAAEHARSSGAEVSDHAALAGAASGILAALQPTLLSESMLQRDAEEAAWAGYWQGHDTPAGVARGQAIGRAAAAAVLKYAASDGAAQAPRAEMNPRDAHGVPIPAEPGVWVPTPRMLQPGSDPHWGEIRPIVLPSGAAARVPPPPAWDSAEFERVRESFHATQQQLTEAERAIAWKWDHRQGTETPVGAWHLIARDLVLREQMGLRASARLFAVLGAAIHDSVIACWESKYVYRVARPIQWMRETVDAHWLPPLVDTPNHPSYPSGHSSISAAAATVLAFYFPHHADELDQLAHEASQSRVLGGIHWPLDTEAGLVQGRQVAEIVLAALAEEH